MVGVLPAQSEMRPLAEMRADCLLPILLNKELPVRPITPSSDALPAMHPATMLHHQQCIMIDDLVRNAR